MLILTQLFGMTGSGPGPAIGEALDGKRSKITVDVARFATRWTLGRVASPHA